MSRQGRGDRIGAFPDRFPGGRGSRRASEVGGSAGASPSRPRGRVEPGKSPGNQVPRIRSRTTNVQATRHASRMSGSARRPRTTVQEVVSCTAPASRPTSGPNRRAARVATPRASRAAAIAEGNRAAVSSTPPASVPDSAISQVSERRLLQPGLTGDPGHQPVVAREHLPAHQRPDRLVVGQPARPAEAQPQRQGRQARQQAGPSPAQGTADSRHLRHVARPSLAGPVPRHRPRDRANPTVLYVSFERK